jgi:YidC/Oxa1 family membrane protein insertase
MNNEKQRLILIVVLMFGWMLFINRLFPTQPRKVPPPDQAKVVKEDAKGGDDSKGKAAPAANLASAKDGDSKGNDKKTAQDQPKEARVDLAPASELVLGSATDKSPDGYRLEVQLDQNGAGIESARSSRYDAEFEGRKNPRLPLHLIRRDPVLKPSMSLTLSPVQNPPKNRSNDAADPEAGATPDGPQIVPETEDMLDSRLWEVVRDSQGRAVHSIPAADPNAQARQEGQEVTFRTTAASGVIVTKTFRLRPREDGLEVELKFESPDQERTFTYNLLGPHGLPIEGEWYTQTFREVFFSTLGSDKIDPHTAYDIAKGKEFDSTALPLRFAGVENQYFAIFMAPVPAPTGQNDRRDSRTIAVLLHKDDDAPQKSDVGVRLSSRPITVGPNAPEIQSYRVFLGPKTADALSAFDADTVSLSGYRKSFIPGAYTVAQYFIAPALSITYNLTTRVAKLFGGTTGNWGIAIILMTLLVKLLMFPLGRKQALMAQRMQALQPYMKELQEKYKDEKEKEKLTRETLALYKKHGVNPVSGCIPALIQLPIFVGLWAALNSNVGLRHSPFLWINDLAAPDMLFRLPIEIKIPFVGASLGHWFNLLPIVVVGLMLFQTKLFSPPPTTPEAEMQQKMMKVMMIVMAAVFYKVPSGLGIYFITSSLWSIGERLLLPKISHAGPPRKDGEEAEAGGAGDKRGGKGPAGGRGGPGGNGPAAPKKPPGALGQFWEKVLEDARKNPTYRKMLEEREQKEDKQSSDDRRDRDRGKPRARPGKK